MRSIRRPATLALASLVYAFVIDAEVASAEPRPPLGSSDAAILVPVKALAEPDAIFKAQGTGLCNAVQLGATPTSLMTTAQFARFAAKAFARGADGKCNAVGEGGSGGSDAEVLGKGTAEHLARIRGLAGRVCRYDAWRVTGFRFDPCTNRAGKNLATRADLASCTPRINLVAQPWSTEGTPFPDDVAIHLIYVIPDAAAVAADIFDFADVTRKVTAGNSWDEADADPNVFRPHPGLRTEMARCDGPASKAYRALLAKHAVSTRLEAVAFMTSSTAQVQWSFGVSKPADQWSVVPDLTGDRFDNFSSDLFEFGSSFPMNQSLKRAAFPTLAGLYGTDILMSAGALDPAAASKAATLSKAIPRIENPSLTSQSGTNCLSCHSTAQTRTALLNKGVKVTTEGGPPAAKVWPPFEPDRRSTTNFRNFGYGPSFSMGVSPRALNEIADVRRTLNTLFR